MKRPPRANGNSLRRILLHSRKRQSWVRGWRSVQGKLPFVGAQGFDGAGHGTLVFAFQHNLIAAGLQLTFQFDWVRPAVLFELAQLRLVVLDDWSCRPTNSARRSARVREADIPCV